MSDLPSGWALSTVGAVGRIQLGRQRAPKYHSGPNMRPYLRVKNVFEDRIDLRDVHEMDFGFSDYETYKLEYGDILLNEGQSPELVGRPAMYRGELPDVCFTNSLIRFRPYAGVNRQYALFLFRHHLHSGRFRREARITTNIAHLSAGRLSTVEFPVPPCREQHRIVEAIEEQFSRVDAGVASLQRAKRNLRRLRASILSAAIEGRLVESGGEAPEVALGTLLSGISAGKSFRAIERPAVGDEWGVIKVSAMTWGRFKEQENKAIPPGREIDPRFEIRTGDLLLSRANTSAYVGATVLVRQTRPRLLLSDKSMRLDPKDDVDKRWLQIALSAPPVRAQMSAVATGTSDSMRNISQDKVRELRLRFPALPEQQRIVEEVDRQFSILDAMAATVDAALVRADRLRQSILREAFAGRLVSQDPSDESASALLERIHAEQAKA